MKNLSYRRVKQKILVLTILYIYKLRIRSNAKRPNPNDNYWINARFNWHNRKAKHACRPNCWIKLKWSRIYSFKWWRKGHSTHNFRRWIVEIEQVEDLFDQEIVGDHERVRDEVDQDPNNNQSIPKSLDTINCLI